MRVRRREASWIVMTRGSKYLNIDPQPASSLVNRSRRWSTVCARAFASHSHRWLPRTLPVAALCVTVGVDLILGQRSWPLLINGPLDEIGHLLTAVLLLAA